VPLDVRGSALVFAALGDERRLHLVMRLSQSGPMSISRLADGAGVTRQAISRHLGVLEGAGVARSERRGRERIWEIEPAQLQVARRYLDVISQRWDNTLARMKASIEANERGTTTTVPQD
jgi:DNA-binding transcriptional ArsR family regulator